MRSIVWFRADLRTRDNPALAHAAEDSDEVIALFIICPKQWQKHDWADIKVAFILNTLRELSAELGRLNISLLIREVPAFGNMPKLLADLCAEHGCEAVYANREYEVNEQDRDKAVCRKLRTSGVAWRDFHDQVLAAPGTVRTGDDTYYSVFTPFRKNLTQQLTESGIRDELVPKRVARQVCRPDRIPESVAGFDAPPSDQSKLWPAGERLARQRLSDFVDTHILQYKDQRDDPAKDTTSRLSPYLTVGALSIHQCMRAATEANEGKLQGGASAVDTWISELIWREFYRHILVGFPRVSMRQPFKTETRALKWSSNEVHFKAWQDGRTGYPIVDAGMRQLLAEGWMHNRVRMITAMFLTKDLWIDWRRGEQHFMRHLIDGDLASNNGGWQWSASTGTDAAPYFRIFNPTSQSRKVDKVGDYIRRYVPELADLASPDIHAPNGSLWQDAGYPAPIVDHASARLYAIEQFKHLKS